MAFNSIKDEYDADGNYIGNSPDGNAFHGKPAPATCAHGRVSGGGCLACDSPFLDCTGCGGRHYSIPYGNGETCRWKKDPVKDAGKFR